MIEIIDNVYVVFDDGGMIKSNPDNTGFEISYKVYERILELAKHNEIKIPIACTASFFDIDGIYNKSVINPNSEKILRIISDNKEYLEIWNHGLTHMYENEYTEFNCYNSNIVAINVQKEKIELSQKIFLSLGIETNTFVPPGHAWETGKTDKIAKEYGIQNIAIREFEKTPVKEWIKNPYKRYKSEWESSLFLNTYFRLGLGIAHDKYIFDKRAFTKTSLYLKNNLLFSILSNRKFKLKYNVNHFFAHVQNMQGDSGTEYFNFVIKELKKLAIY